MKKRILLALSCLWAWLSITAHAYMFRHLEVADGLSNNSVYAIYKDKEGFMWFGTGAGLNRFDGYTFKVYRHLNNDPHSLPNNSITEIKETPDGWLWIKTERNYALFNKAEGVFVSDLKPFMKKLGSRAETPHYVFVDKSGYTWLFASGEGCYRYRAGEDPLFFSLPEHQLPVSGISAIGECQEGILLLYDTGRLVCIDSADLHLKWTKEEIPHQLPESKYAKFSLYTDAENCVWIYSVLGVWVYDVAADVWHEDWAKQWRNQNDFVHAVMQDAQGRIWLGKDYRGIDVFDKQTGEVVTLANNEDDVRSLSHNTVYQLYADSEGLMWVGTYKKGVSYYGESMFKFSIEELGDITCIEQADADRLWLGTNDGGLLLWNIRTERLEAHPYAQALSSNPIVALLKTRDGKLWVGTFNGGLYCIDQRKVTQLTVASAGLSSNNVWTLAEDPEGTIWIGYLDAGIQCLHPQTGTLETFTAKNSALPDNLIYSLCLMPGRTLAIGTVGVCFMDMSERKIRLSQELDQLASGPNINQLYADSRGWLWVATQEGLKMYDPQRRLLKDFPEITGEPGEVISGIAEDQNHDMWIASTRRMVHLKVLRKDADEDVAFESWVYNEKDGLQNCDFNQRSIKTLDNGWIVAGGLYGINLFNPAEISYNKVLPRVLFTGLYLLDKEVEVGREYNGNLILPEELNKVRRVELDADQNIFTVELATDNFTLPEKTRFRYRLKGSGSEWIKLPSGMHRITFSNLAPRTYQLEVQAVNSDGYESLETAQLCIVIRPPFFLTWWAYLCYFSLIVCALFFARRIILKREREKYHLQQIEREAAKNEEINNMKFRFFTNISHELRTPLTLIIAPLEELLKEPGDDSKRKRLMLMYRNARRLLMLVNQLLDFRKGEMSGHKLSLSEGDIVGYIHGVCDSFLLMADKKQIRFSFFSAMDSLPMAFDADKVGKIVMNLLSNAFKYTPSGGRVTILLECLEGEEKTLEIKVSDTGIGISDEEKEHVFDRFYQTDHKGAAETTGTGIGLSLVHDFVTLHGGTVSVFDNIEAGSVFVVRLPVKHIDGALAPVAEPVETVGQLLPETVQEEPEADRTRFPLLLLVDDNADFLEFMSMSLGLQYRIETASNGQEAWDKMQSRLPDLVVSDVMMPVMDGNALCRLIKETERTAHVPVVLLTAKQAVESQVEGLQVGADDYVTKPFNLDILLLRINKLIQRSHILNQQADASAERGKIDPAPSRIEITSLDEKLIEKAIRYVEDNISRSDLSVEEMSREMGMSRVHLYKKLLQITGKTPVEFIRIIRLKRAAQLLRESQLNVSEVAYEVGFNSPKLFSSYFKKEFGILPSAYSEKGER